MKRIMPFLLLLFVTFSCSNSMLDSTDISIGVDLSELNLNYTSLDNLENNSKFKVSLYEVEKPEQVPVDYKSVDKSLYKMLASSYSSINDTKQASVVLNDIPVGINAFIIAEVFENDVDSSNVLYAGISKVFEVLPEKNIVDLELESTQKEPVIENFTLKFILSNQTENEITDIESGSSINIADKVKLDGYNVKFYEDANYSEQIYVTKIVINSDVTIYVELEAITYYIGYELNDGRWNDYSANTYYTVETVKNLSIPGADCILRDGYTFEGWYKDADYTEKITSLEGLFEDITLYAKWEVINYSIEYKLNEGTWADTFIPIESYTIESAVDFRLPTSDKIIREGYVFEGWYDNTGYAIDSLVGRTGDLILYAKWRGVNQVATVKFSAQAGGVDAGTNITLTCGTENATIYYSYEGKEFNKDSLQNDGWQKYTSDATATSEGITIFANGTTNSNSVTIYAIAVCDGMTDSDVATIEYTLNVYTLNFDAKGGTLPDGMQSSEQVTSGDTYKILGDLTKTGYNFIGWYLSETPDATEDPIVEYVPNIEDNPTKIVTFYAKWEPIEYKVTFDPNGGTATTQEINQYFTYDVAQELDANPFTRADYTFKGWNTVQNPTDTNPGVSYADKQSVINLTTSEEITLYAQWEANKSTITVTMPTYSDIQGELKEPTRNDDGTKITFTAPSEYTNYNWYVDGVKQTTTSPTAGSWTFDTTNLLGGIYTIMLVVEDLNGNKYSAEWQITVTK